MKSKSRIIDAALVALCLALTVLAVKGHWSPLPRPVIAGAGLLGSAAQCRRRRFPHVATVAGAASYALSGNIGPLVLGLYSGGEYAPRRHAWFLAVAGWAGFAGWSWIDEGRPQGDDLLYSAVGAVVVLGVGLYAAARRELDESLRERAERAEADRSRRDEQARSAERGRIAREMHDVLAHKLSLIALHAGALELGAPGSAALIRVTAREALAELRTVLSVLREEPVPYADLTALVESSTRAGQLVDLIDRAGQLPPETARIVYRVAQEGLTNAGKHAPGAPVTVRIERGPARTLTVVVHNGPATGDALDLPGAGAGLIGLTERLRLAGGSLDSGPDGTGWQLRAVIPSANGDGQ